MNYWVGDRHTYSQTHTHTHQYNDSAGPSENSFDRNLYQGLLYKVDCALSSKLPRRKAGQYGACPPPPQVYLLAWQEFQEAASLLVALLPALQEDDILTVSLPGDHLWGRF